MDVNVSQILQALIETIIVVVLPIALKALVTWLNAKVAETKAKFTKEQLSTAQMIINTLVAAAEQSGLRDGLAQAGELKKQQVLDQAQAALTEHGIALDINHIDSMIEAAVYEAFTQFKDPLAPEPVE